ncbi:Zn-dependent amino-or carboxypeptidase, M28 family [Filimonas lacunae]|uniref:Zn-dependent amino-or carboxypeptidase, M28 family n=1 Tax=Filimonas lacunae TaxID=477680 RepID=A0A173MCQ2_9BACT|nr:M28 family metallopeptidase [Filimonas lacunae]BAV05238.1 peptidase, M28 family [Filimonas lacunae]SIT22451.1 Zn-dependent amino-or carboxypeptidase, M28 family [Filimonas lacunae]
MNERKWAAWSAALFLLGACNSDLDEAVKGLDTTAALAINDTSFARHIQVLASDSFEGRKPFTAGEEKTIDYLSAQFKALGLQPGNGSSYVQDVPMVEIHSKPAGPLVFTGKTGSLSLNYLDDYVAATRRVKEQVSIANSPVVFAGYGIVAPEYNWNDYAGLDVKGKTVLVMVNDPGFVDSSLFKGRRMTYYGRWTYKFEEAARQGASGIIIIHDTKPASYGWTVVRSSWSKSKLYLQTADDNMSRAVVEGWITTESAAKLFQLAGVSPDLLKQAGQKGFKPVDLGVTTSLVVNNELKKSTSHNVLALLPGTDRKDEVVIYSAHWDHFGKGEAINGDSIYNGAVDNASGTAALLEIATAFSKAAKKPSRSVLFLSVTSEEQGLLGSEYYTMHPVFPVTKTVADINMDVLQPFGRMQDIGVVGYGQSELDKYAVDMAGIQGRMVHGEPDPSGGWYFRSDHFNFAKVGIPALYIENGIISTTHEGGWGRAQGENYNKHIYHSPKDEYNPSWDFSGMVEDARLLFNVGYKLSNESSFPKWKEGSEFKAIRDKQQVGGN